MIPDNAQLQVSHNEPAETIRVQTTVASRGWIDPPAETIYHILCLLEPQDLIRLQAVSKLFHFTIRDPAVWRTIYTTLRLPLPPGPFPWQSVHFLQRVLVQSARLARTWITEPFTVISRCIFTGPRSIEIDRCRWVHGRWLITSKSMKQLWLRDIETDSEQVLWDHGPFVSWAVTSVINSLGHFIYVAVHLGKRPSDPVKLLEFAVDDDTGYLSGPEILDVPTWSLPREGFIPRIRVDSGIAPYVYISLNSDNKPRQSLIFDPRVRRFYKFPRFQTQLDLLLNYRGAWLPHLVEVYFTETHLLVLNRSYLIHGMTGHVEVIQVFAFPDVDSDPNDPGSNHDAMSDANKHTVHELRLTHEIHSRDTGSFWLTPIRNSTVDPITRTTTLRFLHTYAPFDRSPETRVRLVCTDYILPDPGPGTTRAITTEDVRSGSEDGLFNHGIGLITRSTEPVLPVTVESHDVFSVQGVWNSNMVDASDDGFVRGLCIVSQYGQGSDIPNVVAVHKFAVDATGPRCVAVVGDPSPPWVDFETSRHCDYTFDGTRGKMWNIKGDVLQMDSAGQPVNREVLAIVTDFR